MKDTSSDSCERLSSEVVADFRQKLRDVALRNPTGWSASRQLVAPDAAARTVARLRLAIVTSTLVPDLREALCRVLAPGESLGVKAVRGDDLRGLTGLNPTKAIRNLCLLLDIGNEPAEARVSVLAPMEVEDMVRRHENPFDILLDADVASIVDFGAGDLTFQEQVVRLYLPALELQGRDLIVHAIDRIDIHEDAGTLVQIDRDRFHRLNHSASSHLQFRFFGKRDMFQSHPLDTRYPRYTISVCNSPASPTFAYEPSRLSSEAIQRRLRETKGQFRRTMMKGREVLEVQHGHEQLTFPAWKFDIYGPLTLLDLLSRSGKLCVVGAIDAEVFWEILSQLLADEKARPPDVFFSKENVEEYFGATYTRLASLALGDKAILENSRQNIPRVLAGSAGREQDYGFRYIEIRRGALFPGMPAGRTAHIFHEMKRETAPWFIMLVPNT